MNPTVLVVPDATLRDNAFGRPEETAVDDFTTEIDDAEFNAAQASKASAVPRIFVEYCRMTVS